MNEIDDVVKEIKEKTEKRSTPATLGRSKFMMNIDETKVITQNELLINAETHLIHGDATEKVLKEAGASRASSRIDYQET